MLRLSPRQPDRDLANKLRRTIRISQRLDNAPPVDMLLPTLKQLLLDTQPPRDPELQSPMESHQALGGRSPKDQEWLNSLALWILVE